MFSTRIETATLPDGVRVELATIVHDSREFTNLGATIDTARGIVCAYVQGAQWVRGEIRRYSLTTWDGTPIAPLTLVRCYQSRVPGRLPVTMYAWRATIEVATYSGRNGGPGLFVRIRASKAGAS